MSERFPAIPMPTGTLESQRATLLALKEAMEMLTGQRGTELSRAASSSDYAALTANANSRVSKGGDTMTGLLTLSGDPSTALQAATKQYADGKVAKAGDIMTGLLTLSGDPSTALQAATKQYADTKAPVPTSSTSVVGEIRFINPGFGTNYTLPAGGSWLTFRAQFSNAGTYAFAHDFNILAGGTSLGAPGATFAWVGWTWRIA